MCELAFRFDVDYLHHSFEVIELVQSKLEENGRGTRAETENSFQFISKLMK